MAQVEEKTAPSRQTNVKETLLQVIFLALIMGLIIVAAYLIVRL